MKFAACFQYRGTNYCGWQIQKKQQTIQETCEKAFSYFLNHNVKLITCGRTDSGVHALSSVAHFETDEIRKNHSYLKAINALLPNDISLFNVEPVDESFSARFDATARRYIYLINTSAYQSCMLDDKTLHFPYDLDVNAIRDAAKMLEGEHDFASFRSSQCQAKTSIRTIYYCKFLQNKNYCLIDIKANAFLHHMVRNIVSCLLQIGISNKPKEWIKYLLSVKDRTQAAATANACGLYLYEVDYHGYNFNHKNGIEFLPLPYATLLKKDAM